MLNFESQETEIMILLAGKAATEIVLGEIDVLLIDDIQYIAGREATQEEFFRIFNLLLSNKKQIVLASSIEPWRMHNLEGRIYSRFVRGACC